MNPAEQFAKLMFELTKKYNAYMDEALSPYLTEAQLTVLEFVHEQKKVKPSDILPYLATSPAAVTMLLDRMEKSGLIARLRDEKDRRIVWVNLTEKGKREVVRGKKMRERFFQTMLGAISEHNQQLFLYLFRKLIEEGSSLDSDA